MKDAQVLAKAFWQRVSFSALFLVWGLLIFVVFSHMRPILPKSIDIAGRIVMTVGFLTSALLARRSASFKEYWQILFACFIASLATAIDYYLPSRDWLLRFFCISIKTPAGIAIDKLDSSMIIIACIILLTRASGSTLSTLYLRRGHLKNGLIVGLIAFSVAVVGSIPVSKLLFGVQNLQIQETLLWTPWILIFVLGNAFNEELLYRGLFLQKYSPFVGRFCSNLVIAIPFALHHTGVSYTPDTVIFLAILVPLALAWGYIMQKTDSLWGSVLFHAGTDIPIALSLFSALD